MSGHSQEIPILKSGRDDSIDPEGLGPKRLSVVVWGAFAKASIALGHFSSRVRMVRIVFLRLF
jgi:hypothetical protein